MTDLVVNESMTKEQLALIKSTLAKNATDDELKLFLYRAKNLGLDPLKPGQIYFVKYGAGPGMVVVGIEGSRSIAGRTGKHAGTTRGVTKDDAGKIVSAWAKVYRSDWKEPAYETVDMAEYNTGKSIWLTKPGTMLKKVAEMAALRMAFPDQLGGIYSPEEQEKETHELVLEMEKE